MAFTKQHFDYLAAIVAAGPERFQSNRQHAWFAADMADSLKLVNPRFDKAKFIMACMPSEYEGTTKEAVWMAFALRAQRPSNIVGSIPSNTPANAK